MADTKNEESGKKSRELDDATEGITQTATADGPDPRLLELLVCPLTKTRLSYDRVRGELVSKAAGLAFPIRHGVPLMTVEAARQLDDE
jgi:uncharacterized protein